MNKQTTETAHSVCIEDQWCDCRDPRYWRVWMEKLAKVPGAIDDAPPARYRNYVVHRAKDKSFRQTPLTARNITVLVKLAEPLAIVRVAVDHDGSSFTDTFFEIPTGNCPRDVKTDTPPPSYGLDGKVMFRKILKHAREVLGTPENLARRKTGRRETI
jgi:hypothetical protein